MKNNFQLEPRVEKKIIIERTIDWVEIRGEGRKIIMLTVGQKID